MSLPTYTLEIFLFLFTRFTGPSYTTPPPPPSHPPSLTTFSPVPSPFPVPFPLPAAVSFTVRSFTFSAINVATTSACPTVALTQHRQRSQQTLFSRLGLAVRHYHGLKTEDDGGGDGPVVL